MIHPRLTKALSFVNNWCRDRDIPYDIVVDETDLQGIMLFKKDKVSINELLNALSQLAESEGIHTQTQRVRGGNIIAFSLDAISESTMNQILRVLGEGAKMTFTDKIDQAFDGIWESTNISEQPIDFEKAASNIISEVQYKTTENNLDRANAQGVLGGPSVNNLFSRQKTTKGGTKGSKKGAIKGSTAKFEDKICKALELPIIGVKSDFNIMLRETLGGIATQTGQQPADLFQKFAKSLEVLGGQLGIGPLQDRLKEQGINWKKSDDGLSIILYIVNAQTKAPQPIARISAETLEKPNEFEEQLTNMLDFAHAQAPGTTKQKREEIRNQEKAVRDVARAVSPQQEDGITQQINGNNAGSNQVTEPAVDQAVGTAGEQATTIAASPKPELAKEKGLNRRAQLAQKLTRKPGLGQNPGLGEDTFVFDEPINEYLWVTDKIEVLDSFGIERQKELRVYKDPSKEEILELVRETSNTLGGVGGIVDTEDNMFLWKRSLATHEDIALNYRLNIKIAFYLKSDLTVAISEWSSDIPEETMENDDIIDQYEEIVMKKLAKIGVI